MTPSSFKWVEARNKCNADLCFDLLVEQVESDVESINNLKARSNKAWTFTRQNGKVIVALSVDGFHDSSIVFTLSKEAIAVKLSVNSNYTPLFEAIPHLLDDTRCKLEIDSIPVEIWQVSRRALEQLFFKA